MFSNIQYGDIVNWNSANWNVTGMEEYYKDYDDICKPKVFGLIFMPGPWNIHQANNICKILKGKMNVISDQITHEKMTEWILGTDSCHHKSE